uniref:Putative secreted protein n=1 Tax=Xenopsylla cheopis TaxID=163159 RepID=A0A6M2DXZ3_XENCH
MKTLMLVVVALTGILMPSLSKCFKKLKTPPNLKKHQKLLLKILPMHNHPLERRQKLKLEINLNVRKS